MSKLTTTTTASIQHASITPHHQHSTRSKTMKTKPTPIKTIERELLAACEGKDIRPSSFASCPIGRLNKALGNVEDCYPEFLAEHYHRTVTEIWSFIWGFDNIGLEVSQRHILQPGTSKSFYALGQRLRKTFIKS